MALRVNVESKAPKFKGDETKYNVVVSGPHETFAKSLCPSLELNGLAPLVNEGGVVIWSSMPQIGGAPYYMAHMLALKHNAQIHGDCRKQAMTDVNPREPQDGIDHIPGARGSIPTGRLSLNVIASSS